VNFAFLEPFLPLDKLPRTNEGLFCVSGGTGHQSEAVEPC